MDVGPSCVIQKSFWVRAILALMDVISKVNFCYERVVKEAALHSLLLIYILHIDLIHNVMHNIYTLHNGKPFHNYWYIYCIHLGHMTQHLRLYFNCTMTLKAISIFKSSHVASKNADKLVSLSLFNSIYLFCLDR